MGYKKFIGPGSWEWVTRNSWEKLSTFSPDFPVNFRGFPGKIPGNIRGFFAKLLLGTLHVTNYINVQNGG